MKLFLIQPQVKGAFKSPPLGLQCIATVLKQHGFKNIYDIDPNKGDDPRSLDFSGEHVLVGMTVTFMTLSAAFALAQFIKSRNTMALIIFGGPQATLMPEESINNESVDVVAIGEGAYTMLEITEKVEARKSLEGIDGIWFKNENGEVRKNKPRSFIKDLDTLPFADRTFFNDEHYRKHQHSVIERIFVPTRWHVMSAQSCPFVCKMCQPALRKIAGPWRQRSVSNIINEIRFLKEKYSAKYFTFNDNDMGIDRRWMTEFCVKAKKIDNISMACLGRTDMLDYEILRLMKEAGFDIISFGAESGSDRVLREIMNKKTSVQNTIDVAHYCYELNIMAYAYWMLANPGETIEEMKETAELASELPVFYCQFHIANPNPGTHYYFDALQGGYLNMDSWDTVHDRRHPTIIKENVTINDIIEMDEFLIRTMVRKGWNYQYNGHTLAFFNTKLFARRYPIKVFGNEFKLFLDDFRPYHFRNVFVGMKSFLRSESIVKQDNDKESRQ